MEKSNRDSHGKPAILYYVCEYEAKLRKPAGKMFLIQQPPGIFVKLGENRSF